MATASNNAHAPAQDEGDLYDDDLDDEGEGEEDDDDESSPSHSVGLRRLTEEEVRIRVHQVEIRGCRLARRAAVGPDLARAATVRDLVRAAAGERPRCLGAFDAVSITLDAAPPVLPGKYGGGVVVLVDVSDASRCRRRAPTRAKATTDLEKR